MIKLKNHPYAQCHIEVTSNGIEFISYNTLVVLVSNKSGKRTVECTGTYSQTTRKQIGWFCKEYLPDLCYSDMKRIAGKGEIEL